MEAGTDWISVAAVVLPGRVMFGRILDVIFGEAKPLSGSMTAVALLALIAVGGNRRSAESVRYRRDGQTRNQASQCGRTGGRDGCPLLAGRTAFVSVELIGLWAVVVGVLELISARHSSEDAADRSRLTIAAMAAIVIGICMMIWVFSGAVLVSALLGIAAAARGVSLIVTGISERSHQFDGEGKQAAA
jgi:hypothetical protein